MSTGALSCCHSSYNNPSITVILSVIVIPLSKQNETGNEEPSVEDLLEEISPRRDCDATTSALDQSWQSQQASTGIESVQGSIAYNNWDGAQGRTGLPTK